MQGQPTCWGNNEQEESGYLSGYFSLEARGNSRNGNSDQNTLKHRQHSIDAKPVSDITAAVSSFAVTPPGDPNVFRMSVQNMFSFPAADLHLKAAITPWTRMSVVRMVMLWARMALK